MTAVFHQIEQALANIAPVGVVHVGAHKGQEVAAYRRAGFGHIVLVEANPKLWPTLDRITNVTIERCAAGRKGQAILHVTEWDERSSLLAPLKYPLVDKLTVPVVPLADMQTGCNVAVLDVQGSELDVLRTADLARLDAVVVEVCDRPRYTGAALRADVETFMTESGWVLTGTYGGHSAPDLVDQVWKAP